MKQPICWPKRSVCLIWKVSAAWTMPETYCICRSMNSEAGGRKYIEADFRKAEIRIAGTIAEGLERCCRKTNGDTKASLNYLRRYVQTKDSLNEIDNARQLIYAGVRYKQDRSRKRKRVVKMISGSFQDGRPHAVYGLPCFRCWHVCWRCYPDTVPYVSAHQNADAVASGRNTPSGGGGRTPGGEQKQGTGHERAPFLTA